MSEKINDLEGPGVFDGKVPFNELAAGFVGVD